MEDTAISRHFDDKTSLQNTSTKVGNVGLYSTWALPGAFLAFGKLGGNEHMVNTGEKGLQAAVYSTAVMHALKILTNRARPDDGGNGSFLSGGSSFPSGHAMEVWALAKVMADEYPNKRFVKIGMYSFATAVSLSRITAERHFASDVLVGSALGYMIGNFVMRDHHHAAAAAQ
jgi:membrane-associated phospholipid phosphatase